MLRGETILRGLLVALVVAALLLSLGVGWQRIRWEASYKRVGLAIPYQELSHIVHQEDELLLKEHLERLRKIGVVALTLELSSFPDWGLQNAEIDGQLARVLRQAQALGIDAALVVENSDIEKLQRALALRPSYILVMDLPPLEVLSESAAATLRSASALLGVVEFAEPLALPQGVESQLVRAHAIKSRELERLALVGALERWERAVQERHIRLLWVTEHERFAYYLERLSDRLQRLGFTLDRPLPPEMLKNSPVYLAIGLGFVALLLFLLERFWKLSWGSLLAVGSVGGLAFALWGASDLWGARQALALTIAAITPGALILLLKERLEGWRLWLAVSLGSIGAGLAIGALLSDTAHFLKVAEFRGVKIALITPSLLVIATELLSGPRASALRAELRRGAWVVPLLGLAVLFLVLERSGNLPLIAVARWEEALREHLENLFIARPRFKEFLIGHPALFLWRAPTMAQSKLLSLSLLALGALGQASIINTFAHLHTPLALSLWRTLNGLILGAVVGLAVRGIFLVWLRWREHRRSS